MAAILPTSVPTDTAFGQTWTNGSLLVLPFAASDTDTYTVPAGMVVVRSAWEGATSADICGTSITRLATTTRITFGTGALADPVEGNLLLLLGGAS